MMLGEQQPVARVEAGVQGRQLPAQQVPLEQLLAQAVGRRFAERRESPWREGQPGVQQAADLEQRLVVEGDEIDPGQRRPPLGQAIGGGVPREARVEPLAGEAFLLRGGDDPAVLDQGGGAVAVEGRYAENPHPAS